MNFFKKQLLRHSNFVNVVDIHNNALLLSGPSARTINTLCLCSVLKNFFCFYYFTEKTVSLIFCFQAFLSFEFELGWEWECKTDVRAGRYHLRVWEAKSNDCSFNVSHLKDRNDKYIEGRIIKYVFVKMYRYGTVVCCVDLQSHSVPNQLIMRKNIICTGTGTVQ